MPCGYVLRQVMLRRPTWGTAMCVRSGMPSLRYKWQQVKSLLIGQEGFGRVCEGMQRAIAQSRNWPAAGIANDSNYSAWPTRRRQGGRYERRRCNVRNDVGGA